MANAAGLTRAAAAAATAAEATAAAAAPLTSVVVDAGHAVGAAGVWGCLRRNLLTPCVCEGESDVVVAIEAAAAPVAAEVASGIDALTSAAARVASAAATAAATVVSDAASSAEATLASGAAAAPLQTNKRTNACSRVIRCRSHGRAAECCTTLERSRDKSRHGGDLPPSGFVSPSARRRRAMYCWSRARQVRSTYS